MTTHSLHDVIADPTAFFLFSYGTVVLVWSAIQCEWFTGLGVSLAPVSYWYGGVAQLIAGLIEFLRGSTITAAAYTAYSFYWIALGQMSAAAYSAEIAAYPNPRDYYNQIGFWYLGYFFVSVGTTVGVLRSNYCIITLLVLVDILFLIDSINSWIDSVPLKKFNGYVGVVSTALAFYIAISLQWAEGSNIKLPLFPVRREQLSKQESYRNDKDLDVEPDTHDGIAEV